MAILEPVAENTRPKRKQGRSPNYPAISIISAVEIVKAAFLDRGVRSWPSKKIPQALGKNHMHSCLSILAALKAYGLVECIGDDYKLTDLGEGLVTEPDTILATNSMFNTTIFGRIHELDAKLKSSDPALKAWLRTQGFTKVAIPQVIKNYRAIIDYLNNITITETSKAAVDEPVVQKYEEYEIAAKPYSLDNEPKPTPLLALPAPVVVDKNYEITIVDGVIKVQGEVKTKAAMEALQSVLSTISVLLPT